MEAVERSAREVHDGVCLRFVSFAHCGSPCWRTRSSSGWCLAACEWRIRFEIAPCGDLLCGKLVWFRWPNDAQGQPLNDLKNPDPALRGRPLLGLTVLSGLRPVGEGKWENGIIYNPDDGKTYHAQASFKDNDTLRVRAYVVLPLLGKTLIWSRMR